MRKLVALLLMLMLMLTMSTVVCAERDVMGISNSIPTSSEADRLSLAKQLVVMVFAGDRAETAVWNGSAVLVGMDDNCLYAATADHVVRTGTSQTFWIRHDWSDQAIEAKVLAPHDPSLDVGVLCVAQPQKTLVPLPRVPFYLQGSVRELISGDAMVSIGHGNGTQWRTSTSITFDRSNGDLLFVRGGDIGKGDSGGGLFSRDVAFDEIVGIISRTSEGVTTAISVDALARLFKNWKLPFDLHDWNFREFNSLEAQMVQDVSRNVDGSAPPRADGRARVERLVVSVSGGPAGSSSGVLLGAGDGEVFVGVPWETDAASGEPVKLKFSNGLALSATSAAGVKGAGQVLRATLPAAELTELLQLMTGSPLATAFISEQRLAIGRTLYLAGVAVDGSRQILPRDHIVSGIQPGQVDLIAPAVARRAAVGWAAFDDANNLVGIVTDIGDRTVTVQLMSAWMAHVRSQERLKAWEPTNVPLQISAGGRRSLSSSCTFPRLFRYVGQDRGQGLVLVGDTVVFGALSNLSEAQDTYVAGISLDGNVKFVSRSDTIGAKNGLALALDGSGGLMMGTQVNQSPGAGSLEARHCGLLEAMSRDGKVSSKLLSCELPVFLPYTIRPAGGRVLVGGSVLERQDAVSYAALADVDVAHRSRVLATDKETNSFLGTSPAPDGDVYVIGHGFNRETSSQDVSVSRYSASGELRWKRIDPIQQRQDDAVAVVATGDGGVIAVATSIRNLEASEVLVWRYSASGQLLWKRAFGRPGVLVHAWDATEDGHGGVIVAGHVDWLNPAMPSIDGWLLAVDGNGELRWQKTYAPRHVASHRTTLLRRITRDGDGFWLLADSSSSQTLFGLVLMRVTATGDPDASLCRN